MNNSYKVGSVSEKASVSRAIIRRFAVHLLVVAWGVSFAICACDDDADSDEKNGQDEVGTLIVEVWGEDLIENGLDSDETEDGWSVEFDKFLINLGSISVAEGEDEPAVTIKKTAIWDLVKEGPHQIKTSEAKTGRYDHTAYTISPANDDSVAGNAKDSDVELMKSGGYAVYAKGEASKGDKKVTFSWGFEETRKYKPCHSTADLKANKKETVQITIHGDHLFYDSAVSSDPDLRFEDIALADADDDGEVTAEELAAYEITPLEHYGVGSLDIDNLWDYISHMTGTLGHIDGEGHCD